MWCTQNKNTERLYEITCGIIAVYADKPRITHKKCKPVVDFVFNL